MDIKGFTLIELMVILAIIGIVAVVVIPLYQNYVTKSQVMAAVAELKGAKSQYELIINNGSASGNSDFSVLNMFFQAYNHKSVSTQ
jgi:type IV pilus assembly protein PilA